VNASRTWRLAAATLLSATLTVLSAPLALPLLAFVFKPLTTLLVIAHAWPRGRELPAVRRAVLAGLGLSLLGDVALLWPESGFLAGLLSFLLAHLAYLFAFTRVQPLASWWPAFAAYALLAGGILAALWPGVPVSLRAPVAVYVVCLAAMAAQAAVLGWKARGTGAAGRSVLLALGGALFVSSDALLATNRFASAVPWSGLWILSSYWAAQWCIACWLAPQRARPPACAGSTPPAGS
jgi:uncharacterized membrane protein YhhN